ncbi:hypothetical protein BC835DRAFT_1273609 [Cytidiella melzeri]|nr:hypothetical protein BC835DRAFT_1273609 [Cytidiella melzeri]
MLSSNVAGHHIQPSSTTETAIPRIDGNTAYEQFLRDYLLPNRPVMLSYSLVSSWPAFQLWTTSSPDENIKRDGCSEKDESDLWRRRKIDWTYLADNYGSQTVSVADCSTCDSFGNLDCSTTTFAQVVQLWQRGEGQHLYVKDWHLAQTVETQSSSYGFGSSDDARSRPAFYSIPDLFKDDWMNAYYCSLTNDDFRFVYVGASGTFTPLHRDVYCSYSWSTNICGRKRWWLFPPEQTAFLFVRGGRNVTVHDVRKVDDRDFPEYCKTTPFVVDQVEGETIFVPSGWYHQVENLTDCISINHNWCNSVNLPSLYTSMCDKVVEVENALDDVREMLMRPAKHTNSTSWRREFTIVVQDVVKQDAGWNWLTFWSMIAHVLRATRAPSDAKLLFPVAPASLQPPQALILKNVSRCYDDFVRRDRMECEGEVLLVVQRVAKLLNTIDST